MKITIELDESKSATVETRTASGAGDEAGAADGGAGPAGGAGASGSPGEADSGGPAQDLLDAIAAAEAAGTMPGAADAAQQSDAGPGPASA